MSLFKGPDGIYEADIRLKDLPRVSLSMRTKKLTIAQPRYDALKRLCREARSTNGADRRALLEQVRTGAVAIERLESMVAGGESLIPSASTGSDATAGFLTVDAAIERYVDWMHTNPNKSTGTWRSARTGLKRFADFVVTLHSAEVRLGSLRLDQVTSAHTELYQKTLIANKVATNTVSSYIGRIGALWSWIQRRENRNAIETRRAAVIIHSPIDPELAMREQTARDRWLTKPEATALVAVAPERLLFPIAAGLMAGLRIGEILTLRTYADVDLELGTLSITAKQVGTKPSGEPIIWKPKTRRSIRVVPISSDLRAILEAHITNFASDAWLNPSIEDPSRPFVYDSFNNHFTTVVKNAELISGRKDPRGVVFHTLRHTFASWLIMSGQVDLYTVAQLLGDTLAVVEKTYAHLAPDFKRRAIDAIKGAIAVPAIVDQPRRGNESTASATATREPVFA